MKDTKTNTVSFVDEETEQVLRRNCDHPNPTLSASKNSSKEKGPEKALAKFLAGDVNERRKEFASPSPEEGTQFVSEEKIPSHLRPQTPPLSRGLRFFCDNFVSSIANANRKSS